MRRHTDALIRMLVAIGLMGMASACETHRSNPDEIDPIVSLSGDQLDQLSDLSISSLRRRSYSGGELKVIAPLERDCTTREASGEHPRRASRSFAKYESEGHSIYTRIDVPFVEQAASGYPVMIFAHGWVGAENAPDWHFACTTEFSYGDIYGDVVNAWVDAGYVVLVPGYRGHGTINGMPADGHEDMLAWDNGAYLMPSFYAVDVMNLMASSLSPKGIEVTDAEGASRVIKLDPSRVYINGHSQGGDVALTVLAATGEGAASGLALAGASIWAGNIADRFTQLATFEAMNTSPEAFLSGDGSWTGSAIGQDGTRNPNFIFGYPPDWIATPHPDDWTWQGDTFNRSSVAEALSAKATVMYDTLNSQVGAFGDLSWHLETDPDGRFLVSHDPRLVASMQEIGGTDHAEFLTEPLHLHFSDRDYYSLPAWNETLCAELNAAEGACRTFEYVGSTHSLGLSEHDWFSPPGSVAGHASFIRNDLYAFAEHSFVQGSDCQGGENR
ncbi:MAG: hypothetical protein NXH78_07525 [Hyphomonadaceae bacterium]|nr:hypothetical protein [Hyphomonadaceae bacterium]